MTHTFIQEGDFKLGDMVKVLWIKSIGYNKVGEVVRLERFPSHIRVTIKLSDGKICKVGLRSSLKKIVLIKPEKVMFT